jgi:hypothetical protein
MGAAEVLKVERYAVDSVLGRGGMGVVYAAHDSVRGHAVALKRLATDKFKTPNELWRATALFEREYHTLSQLAHPHIIEVYDYGLDATGPYYTMELLRGETLRALAPMTVTAACTFARDIASALAILHSRRLVHRDVTPLNIHCTPDGRAKLIDFGAMMPVGVPKQIVGTPAFIAPECLQLQILDGQADLYSLGACLYFALTGRHAFHARGLADLRDAWQTSPAPPSTFAAGISEALDVLVLSLLSAQPAGRPRSAAEVFERLTAVAGLPANEQIDVAQAYVTNPALVGRQTELSTLRRSMLKAVRKRGASLLVTGTPGIGKSRVLDAAVLEAQLCGAKVARADASDGQAGALGVAGRLIDCMLREQPELRAIIEARGLTDLISEGGNVALLGTEQRQHLMLGACAVILEACKQQPWVVIVDDLHLIDEPSFAFVASLSIEARKQRLLIVASVDPQATAHAASAMTLLSESSKRLDLQPLDDSGVRALLSSLFGEVPNLDLLCTLAQRTAHGNPRTLMDGTQRLIERQLARYDSGAWLITSDPIPLEAALGSGSESVGHFERLSADGRELLEVLALDRDCIMTLADYAALTDHGDATRMNCALDELIASRVVIPFDDRVRFYRDDQQSSVLEQIDPQRRQELHRRLAERCEARRLPGIYCAYHFLRADLPQRALVPITEFVAFIEAHPGADLMRNSVTLDTLEAIALLPPQADVPAAFCAEQGAGVILNSMYRGLPERVAHQLGDRLAALAPFSGVSDYAELTQLEEPARLMEALTRAAKRCEAAGLANFSVIDAIRRNAQVCLASAVCSHFMADPRLLLEIPDLRPFVALSPALDMTVQLLDAVRMFVRGQNWEAWDVIKRAYEQLRGPAAEQLQGLTKLSLERVALGYLCALEVDHCTDAALQYVDEYAPVMPNLAESHRARYHLACANLPAEQAARRRFEVLSVQANSLSDARIIELPPRLLLYALTDDVMGLRRTLDAIREVAATRPRWEPRALLAQAHLLRCRGAFSEGLAVIECCLAKVDPEQGDWMPSVAAHLELLLALGRFAAVRELGEVYLLQARVQRVPYYAIQLLLAWAHAALGDGGAAEQLLEESQTALAARGCSGVVLGRSFEIGARIAVLRRDQAAFAERAERCAQLYRIEQHPSLAARYTALRRAASSAGLDHAAGAAALESPFARDEMRVAALRSAALEHVQSSDFYSKTLALVVAHVGAVGGALYTCRPEGGMRRVATTDDGELWSDLDREVARFHAREIENDHDTTGSTGMPETGSLRTLHTATGRALIPYLLEHDRHATRTIAGVVVFAIGDTTPSRGMHRCLEAIAELLSDRQDVLSTAMTSQDATRMQRFPDRR